MKTKFVIGEKPSVKGVIVKLIIASGILFMMYRMFIDTLENSPYFSQNAEWIVGIKVILLIGSIIVLLSIITSVSLRQYIVITDKELAYYANDGFVSQIKNTFAMLCNKHREPIIKLPFNQIKVVTLHYNTITSSLYYKGHALVYRITLTDDSCITINPESFHFNNDNIYEGIDFLIKQGVKVEDPYNLMEGLKNKNMKFAEYIDKVVVKYKVNHK